MSTSVDTAFVKQFEREVHEAYQRKASVILNTVRRKPNVVGSSTTFQKVGKGTATTKSRHGLITPMNVSHSNVEAVLSDFYAGDWVDKLDEAKINHDERMVLANAGAWALARKSDNQLITELDATTNVEAHNSTGLTLAKILSAFETLGDNDVFEDGRMYCLVGYNGWADLLQINQFASADFVDDKPFLEGRTAKRWLGTTWIPTSAVNDAKSGSTFKSFWYHEDAIGYAFGSQVTTDITWHGDRAAHFVNHMMSGGAKLIDDNGVVELQHQ